MSSDDSDLRDFLAESDKLIKASEQSLKKIEVMRKELGLAAGASKDLLERIPQNSDQHQEAEKELKKFMEGNQLDTEENTDKAKKKKKRRSRMTKAIHKKLRI